MSTNPLDLHPRSRNGTLLMLYNMDAGGIFTIHGAYWAGEKHGWIPIVWDKDGRVHGSSPHPLDINWEIDGDVA